MAEAQALAEAAANAMFDDDAASQHLGMRIARIAPGEAEMHMDVAPWMANGHGSCHGGFIFTLADSAFAFACNSHNQRAVAQAASIQFVAPAAVGDTLVATAREVVRRGRSGVYDISVARAGGEVVAEFRGQSRQVSGEVVPA